MVARPYVLNEVALKVTRGVAYEVAVLPWGATEPHNFHLPYGTDTIQVEAIAAEAARRSWEAGARVVVLPSIPMGANAQQLDRPLTLNLNPSTQAQILSDVVSSLDVQGIRKLLVLNGHGGNDFRQMIRELQATTSVFLCAANWYTIVDPAAYFEAMGDHAGEMETSVMLHLAPDLVCPLGEAGPGTARRFKVRGFREGVAWAPRDWKQVTSDTGVGDPSAATAEKGSRYLEAVTAALSEFLIDLAAADPDDMYEPEPEGPRG